MKNISIIALILVVGYLLFEEPSDNNSEILDHEIYEEKYLKIEEHDNDNFYEDQYNEPNYEGLNEIFNDYISNSDSESRFTINDYSYRCDCLKLCDEMASCAEAYFQLNTCGCSRRDGDNDGVPCENIC